MKTKKLCLFSVFLLLVSFARSEVLGSSVYGYSIDFPEGFFLQEATQDNTGFHLTHSFLPAETVIRIYKQSQYGNSQEALSDTLTKLSGQGDFSQVDWLNRDCTIADFVINPAQDGTLFKGWAVSSDLPLDKGYIVLLAYSPLGNKDDLDQSMHQFLISVIDSLMFTTQRASYFNSGPVTTFSFPRNTPSDNISEDFSQESPEGSPETSPQNKEAVTLSINGTEVHTAICPQDIEAQEFVIGREFAVLNLYAGTDLAISAWTRYYNQIYRCSFASLEEASFAIFARLREKDSVKNGENKDLALAQELLTWTQSFTYKRDTQSTDFSSPTAVLAGKTFSDCDSRSLLLAILLHQMNYKTLMFLSPVHQHAMLGIAIDAPGAKMAVNNTNYLVGETTAPVAIGLIAKDISVITDWIPVVFPE